VRRPFSALMLLLAAGTVVPAVSASAGTSPGRQPGLQRFGVQLFDVPVPDAHNPRGLRYIIDYLPSGTVIHRRILIVNQESRRAHFTVYPDAARITHGVFIGDAGQTRSELTSWIRVKHPSVTLRPHAAVLDPVTIAVPRSATRGEHYGEIWVQQISRAPTSAGVVLTEVARVGIRIYLAVGRGGAPATAFAITTVTAHRSASGQPLLMARVRNTGERAVDLSGQARLSGPAGITAGPFRQQQVITLAPGQSDNIVFAPRESLPSGAWHAAVTLVSGFTTRTAQGVIQLLPARRPAPAARTPPVVIWGAGIGFLALCILALIRIRQGRRPRRVHA
jgi:hypothetical protein